MNGLFDWARGFQPPIPCTLMSSKTKAQNQQKFPSILCAIIPPYLVSYHGLTPMASYRPSFSCLLASKQRVLPSTCSRMGYYGVSNKQNNNLRLSVIPELFTPRVATFEGGPFLSSPTLRTTSPRDLWGTYLNSWSGSVQGILVHGYTLFQAENARDIWAPP